MAIKKVRVRVMNQIASDGGVWLDTQHINTTQIRQVTIADVMNMVEFDPVISRSLWREPPHPTE